MIRSFQNAPSLHFGLFDYECPYSCSIKSVQHAFIVKINLAKQKHRHYFNLLHDVPPQNHGLDGGNGLFFLN